MSKHEVSFNPQRRKGLVEKGQTLHEAALGQAIEIESLCGGKQKCGKCKVAISSGTENLSPITDAEKKLLTKEEIDAGYRLSCAAEVSGPVSLQIPEESLAGEMVILEGGEEFSIKVDADTVDGRYGMAFDIGTTSVVGYLMNLQSGDVLSIGSLMNPQVFFGEDVMSRIAYTTKNAGGLADLNKIIIDALNKIIRKVTSNSGIESEDIDSVAVVGNTAMHHLFLGIDPKSLGVAPFSPAVTGPTTVSTRELGLDTADDAQAYVLPNVAGFVGADNVGVLIASEPYKQEGATLTIDVGTNGEIVLTTNGKMIAASCATGPALEGAHIKHGMRAKPGAIEHLEIDPSTYDVTCSVIGDAEPKGICGSGVIDAVAWLLKSGLLLKNGKFNTKTDTERLGKGDDGYEFAIADNIVITQKDISEVQLAKGALYAGAKILMKRAGIDRIDRIFLAGAFGSHIDPKSALAIGMLPPCTAENIIAIGNAAGDGARMALINAGKRKEAERIAGEIEYIELTIEPDFEKEFVNALHIPHREGI